MKTKITKDMNINELIDKYPDVIPVLMAYGLRCVGCNFAQHDTLATGAKLHGIKEEELKLMIKDVNKVLDKKEKIK